MRSLATVLIACFALACFTLNGCNDAASTAKDTTKSSQNDGDNHNHDDHDGHEHGGDDHAGDHDAHAHGPNGGHLFDFSGEDYKGEWKHYSDNHVVRVFVLDEEAKEAVPVAAESVTIRRTAGDDGTVFTLDAESPDAEGNASVYSLDSQDLDIAMNLGVIVEMKVGDKTYSTELPPHKPH